MLSKFSSVAFFLLWLGFLNLLVSASPVPIVLPPSEGLELFEDVVARELVADASRRDVPLSREFTEAAKVKRDPIASPDPAPNEEPDVEARICRFGCL